MADARADEEVVGLPDTDQLLNFIDTAEGITLVEDPPNHFRGATPVELAFREALAVEREGREKAERALVECARASGADLSDGVPTWPPLDEWAVRCVQELRRDYDEAGEPPTSRRGGSRDHAAGEPEPESSSRSVALGVAADLRKEFAGLEATDPDVVHVVFSLAARLEGKEE